MYNYAIKFEQYNEPGLAIICRDLPELHGWGDDREHCISLGLDAIETALSIYVDRREAIPKASPPMDDEHIAHLPAVTVAKIVLWNEMMARNMRKADLCRLLGLAQTQGDRLVDFLHTSKMHQLERALEALELYVDLKVMSQNATKLLIRQIHEPTATRYLVHRADKGLDQLGLPLGLIQDYNDIPPKIATVELGGDHDEFWWLNDSADRIIKLGWDAFSLVKLKHDDLGSTHDNVQQKTQAE